MPILVMILYSFNGHSPAPAGELRLAGLHPAVVPGVERQSRASRPRSRGPLIIAFTASITAAVIGTLLALALVRYRFQGKAAQEQTMFLNIAAPEIVLGASLLGLFVTIGVTRGFTTLYLAHVTFSIAYVTITVRARLAGFDRSLEEAARGSRAPTPWVTFAQGHAPAHLAGRPGRLR